MSYNTIFPIFAIGLIGGIIYKYSDQIKIELLKLKSKKKAYEITINFFLEEICKNPNISLDEAILRFENAYDTYNNLHDFAVSKKRDANSYRKAYSQLFIEAKRKYL